jgi:hypothetical protein
MTGHSISAEKGISRYAGIAWCSYIYFVWKARNNKVYVIVLQIFQETPFSRTLSRLFVIDYRKLGF